MLRVLVGSTSRLVTSYPRTRAGELLLGLPTEMTARRVTDTDPDDATVVATMDTLAGVLDGNHVAGERNLRLRVARTFVRGRRYLLRQAAAGKTTTVTAAAGGETDALEVVEPLPFSLADGATLSGILVSVQLKEEQSLNPGSAYVEFAGKVDGAETAWAEAFRLVRRITSIALTPDELLSSYPVIRQLISEQQESPEAVIEAVWRQKMLPLLASWRILDEDVLTDTALAPLHATACAWHLADQWPSAPAEFVERMRRTYEDEKQITKQRIDLAIRDQRETVEANRPGREPARFILATR